MDNQKPQIKYETQEDRKGRTRGNDDQCVFFVFSGFLSSILIILSVLLPKKRTAPRGFFLSGPLNLATSYSRTTYRCTTIGAAAFHFRVRDGNGWCHRAMITRGRNRETYHLKISGL